MFGPLDNSSRQNLAVSILSAIKRRFSMTLEGMLAAARLDWGAMRLHRMLNGEQEISRKSIAPFVDLTARLSSCPVEEAWKLFETGVSSDMNLNALGACRHWKATVAEMEELSRLTRDALSNSAGWTFAGNAFPPFLMPCRPRKRTTNAMIQEAGLSGQKTAVQAWRDFIRTIHRALFPVGEVLPINGLVLQFQSRFDRLMDGPSSGYLNEEDIADVRSFLAFDVIRSRGAVVGFLDDVANPLPPLLNDTMNMIDSLLIVENRLMLMRITNSPIWLTCTRDDRPYRQRFFDAHIGLTRLLRDQVAHGLDPGSSFARVARNYFGPH